METKLTDQELARREKLNRLVELGVNPWGEKFDRTDTTATCREKAGDKSAAFSLQVAEKKQVTNQLKN